MTPAIAGSARLRDAVRLEARARSAPTCGPRSKTGAAQPASRRRKAPCSATSSACASGGSTDVMVPRADIIAVQTGHRARRTAEGLCQRRPFAAGRLRRHARRSHRHGPHPRPDRAHDRRALRQPAAQAGAQQPLPAGLDLKAIDLSMPLSAAKIVREHPVRAALDAGARPARQDAGDPHPSGAGGRRIRRHRRPRLDGGHRRADRRRDRGRARRGRCSGRGAPGRRLLPRRCPREPRGCDRDRRARVRCRRSRQGGRHARRLYRDPHRPRAGARRGRAWARPVRDRGARRRSAPGQATQDLSEPGPPGHSTAATCRIICRATSHSATASPEPSAAQPPTVTSDSPKASTS